MRIHFLIACCSVLFSLLQVSPVRADIDGFKEMKWGAALSEIQRTRRLVLTKENGPNGSSLYSLQDEDLHFGGAVLTDIHCSFSQGHLQGVILLYQGPMDFAAMRSKAFSQFGETKRYDQNGEELYNWAGELTSIVLSYNRESRTGFLFLKSKKTLEQLNTIETTPFEKEIAQETTPDLVPPIVPQPVAPQPVVPQREQVPEATASEIQRLIDRDQELTRLCWGTVGPDTEAACHRMREGVGRLKALGMCDKPGNPGGPETIWFRCKPQAEIRPIDDGKEGLCRQVEELFVAAARMRENDVSSQIAVEELLSEETGRAPEITRERIQETVELVYFNPSYMSSWGEQLQRRVHDSCVSDRGPYAYPLR